MPRGFDHGDRRFAETENIAVAHRAVVGHRVARDAKICAEFFCAACKHRRIRPLHNDPCTRCGAQRSRPADVIEMPVREQQVFQVSAAHKRLHALIIYGAIHKRRFTAFFLGE